MKKLFLTNVILLVMLSISLAQEKKEEAKEGWINKGNISILFNQSTFSNWLAGGESSLSGNLGINYDFNYKRNDWTWDNKILASYGIVKTKNSTFEKKTDDRLEFNSLVGKKFLGLLYYSAILNFRTQITKGYIYTVTNGLETRVENTNFLSPAYLTVGPGLLWKKSDNFKINFAPATSKLVIVDKSFTLPNNAYFGVKEGESLRYELGFYASGYHKFDVMENVSVENILNLYANYLEDPQNVDIDYQLNLVLKINKYLSTNVAFQTIYDDNAFKGFQVREVFGVGLNIGF
jgi:hypothetical protein